MTSIAITRSSIRRTTRIVPLRMSAYSTMKSSLWSQIPVANCNGQENSKPRCTEYVWSTTYPRRKIRQYSGKVSSMILERNSENWDKRFATSMDSIQQLWYLNVTVVRVWSWSASQTLWKNTGLLLVHRFTWRRVCLLNQEKYAFYSTWASQQTWTAWTASAPLSKSQISL